jgi:hypothetical protein
MNERRLYSSRVIRVNVVKFSQDVELLSQGHEVVQAAQETHVFVDIYVHHGVYEDKFSIVNYALTVRLF